MISQMDPERLRILYPQGLNSSRAVFLTTYGWECGGCREREGYFDLRRAPAILPYWWNWVEKVEGIGGRDAGWAFVERDTFAHGREILGCLYCGRVVSIPVDVRTGEKEAPNIGILGWVESGLREWPH